MSATYDIQVDWFQEHVRPRMISRCLAYSAVAAGLLILWLVSGSIIFAAAALAGVALIVFEIVSLPSAAWAASDLRVEITEDALKCHLKSKAIVVDYPWDTLRVVRVGTRWDGTITIEDRVRRSSRIELAGYERMPALIEEIKARSVT